MVHRQWSIPEAVITSTAVSKKRKLYKKGYSSTASLVVIESDNEFDEDHISCDDKEIQVTDTEFC